MPGVAMPVPAGTDMRMDNVCMGRLRRWTFRRDHPRDAWRARSRPPADRNTIEAVETFAFEINHLDDIACFVDRWVFGTATDPWYRGGTEAVGLHLVDGAAVELRDRYGQFRNTEMSRTEFRAVLDGLLRALIDESNDLGR